MVTRRYLPGSGLLFTLSAIKSELGEFATWQLSSKPWVPLIYGNCTHNLPFLPHIVCVSGAASWNNHAIWMPFMIYKYLSQVVSVPKSSVSLLNRSSIITWKDCKERKSISFGASIDNKGVIIINSQLNAQWQYMISRNCPTLLQIE